MKVYIGVSVIAATGAYSLAVFSSNADREAVAWADGQVGAHDPAPALDPARAPAYCVTGHARSAEVWLMPLQK